MVIFSWVIMSNMLIRLGSGEMVHLYTITITLFYTIEILECILNHLLAQVNLLPPYIDLHSSQAYTTMKTMGLLC